MDDLVERVALVLFGFEFPPADGVKWEILDDEVERAHFRDQARAIIPMIYEDAARVADEWNLPSIASAGCDPGTARNVAQSIRSRVLEVSNGKQ